VDIAGALDHRIESAFEIVCKNFLSKTLAQVFCRFTVHGKASSIYKT